MAKDPGAFPPSRIRDSMIKMQAWLSAAMFSFLKKKKEKGSQEADAAHMSDRRSILLNLGILALAFAGSAVVLHWLGGNIRSHAEKIASARASIVQRAGIVQTLAELTRDEPEADRLKTRMDAILPGRDQLIDFPSTVEAHARGYGLLPAVSFVGNEVEPKGNEPGFIPFELRAEGPYENIVRFLGAFERDPKGFLAEFESYDFVRKDDRHVAVVSGKVFFR